MPTASPIARGTRARVTSAVFAGALSLVGSLASASPGPVSMDPASMSPAAIDRLVAISRVQDQATRSMGQLRDGVRARLVAEAASGRLERERLPAIERLVERAYGDEAMHASIREAIGNGLRAGDAEPLLAHLLSPLGQRALDAEDAHAMDDGGAAFAGFTARFAAHPEHDARLARAVEMERVLGFANVVSGLAIDLQRAMLGGLAFSVPADARAEIEVLLLQLDGQRATFAGEMRESMTHYLAFVYEELSLGEQDALNAFLATPASRRFSNALVRGMSVGMQRAGIAFGDGLGRSLSIASADEEI